MARTLSWRCWVRGCTVAKETREAVEKHFFSKHKAFAAKKIAPKKNVRHSAKVT